jgi:hypothetical protein
MSRNRSLVIGAVILSFALGFYVAEAQDRAMSSAPAFSGGVFVTPVSGAPFSAMAVQEMTQALKDGSSFRRKTAALIARDSQGRIHNESHEVVPASSNREPPLLSIHIYDPDTRVNTFLNPYTHIARQRILPNPPSAVPPSNWAQHASGTHPPIPNVREEDLGTNIIEGLDVHGYRRTITLSEKASGTGHPVNIIDEYWYSEELRINMITKHTDPRTGDLLVSVTQLNREEPVVDLFIVPPEYKVVDMTPPEVESSNVPRVIR